MYMIEGTPFTFEEDGFDYTDPEIIAEAMLNPCLLYTSPSPRDNR